MKKGTFSGVIPMMGLFVMAAIMGFQSIPIGQAVSQELTQSFTDLSRSAETKSYSDLYYFNFVPNGAEHSVNNMSHALGKDGGNVDWNDGEFDPENDISTDVRTKTDEIVDIMKRESEEYLNEKYGGVSQAGGCTIPPINYTIDTFPETSDILRAVDEHEKKIPLTVGSQVEVEYSGYGFYPDVEAAPMEVECSYAQGDTKYIGDTQNSGESSSTGPGMGYGLWGDWSSLGYTNRLKSDANRYHILANRTAYIMKRVHDNWVGVGEIENTDNDVCDPSESDWESLEAQTVNDVNSDVNEGFNNVVNSEVPIEGISGDFNLRSFELEFTYDDYSKNFDGEASYSTSNVHGCECHTHEDGDIHCHETEKDLHVNVTPKISEAEVNLTDTKYRVNTEEGWKQLSFAVYPYVQDFQNDDN